MKVRIKLAWQTYSVGEIIDPPTTLANWLVGNGYADRVETGSIEEPIKRGTLTLPKKRR